MSEKAIPATPEELLERLARFKAGPYRDSLTRRECRRELWEKDPRCHYCHRVTIWTNEKTPLQATIEHLLDRGNPRRTEHHNPIVLACHECNNRFSSPAGKVRKKLLAGDTISDHERKTLQEAEARERRMIHRKPEPLSPEHLETLRARRAKRAAEKKARQARYHESLQNQVWNPTLKHFEPQLHAWDWD